MFICKRETSAKLCKLYKCDFLCFFILSRVSTNTPSGQNWRVSRWLFLCYRAPSEEVGALPPTRKQHTVSSQGGGANQGLLGKIWKKFDFKVFNLCFNQPLLHFEHADDLHWKIKIMK